MARRTMTIKRVDPWSVMKVGFLANVVLLGILLLAGRVVWFFIDRLELITKACEAAERAGFEGCGVNGGNIFRNALLLGLLGVVIQTGIFVFGAFLFNLISELTGGLAIGVEDDLAGRQTVTAKQSSKGRNAGRTVATSEVVGAKTGASSGGGGSGGGGGGGSPGAAAGAAAGGGAAAGAAVAGVAGKVTEVAKKTAGAAVGAAASAAEAAKQAAAKAQAARVEAEARARAQTGPSDPAPTQANPAARPGGPVRPTAPSTGTPGSTGSGSSSSGQPSNPNQGAPRQGQGQQRPPQSPGSGDLFGKRPDQG